MATEWTQFGVRLCVLLLAPVVAVVVLAPRSRPGGNDVLQAPAAVEQAAIAVTVNEEESFWTPFSSGTGSRFEGRVAPSPDRDVNRDEPVLAARSRLLADDPLPLGPPEASSKGRQVEPGKKRRFEMRHVRQPFRHLRNREMLATADTRRSSGQTKAAGEPCKVRMKC